MIIINEIHRHTVQQTELHTLWQPMLRAKYTFQLYQEAPSTPSSDCLSPQPPPSDCLSPQPLLVSELPLPLFRFPMNKINYLQGFRFDFCCMIHCTWGLSDSSDVSFIFITEEYLIVGLLCFQCQQHVWQRYSLLCEWFGCLWTNSSWHCVLVCCSDLFNPVDIDCSTIILWVIEVFWVCLSCSESF